MDAHSRFLLTFVLSLRRAAPSAEVFAFNTELVHLTPVARAGQGPPHPRSPGRGGARLVGRDAHRRVPRRVRRATTSPQRSDGRTVVVILSDGLDRGDPALLAEAVRAIQRRARKLIWLNPLLGDPRYEPATARHAGGAALRRPLRVGPRPRVPRAAPSPPGGLSMGLRFEHVVRGQGPAGSGSGPTSPTLPRGPRAARRGDHREGRRADLHRHDHRQGRPRRPPATGARCASRSSTRPARTAEIVASGQDVSGRGGADMQDDAAASSSRPRARPR